MPGAALLFEAVAVSLDLNDVSVMQDAVEADAMAHDFTLVCELGRDMG